MNALDVETVLQLLVMADDSNVVVYASVVSILSVQLL